MGGLKTHYKRIYFKHWGDTPSGKTSIWKCLNHDDECLGEIAYNAKWRKYTLRVYGSSFGYTEFGGSCHDAIRDFCKDLREHELEARKA